MTPDSAELYDRGLDYFSAVVDRLRPQDWDRPSPCEGWSALDVLGHLGTSLQMGTSLLRGEQPTWPELDRPADLVQGEPSQWWSALAEESRAALDGADLDLEMDTPMGPRTVRDRLAFPAIDLYVHAWDIATAAGLPLEIPHDAVVFSHAYIDPLPSDKVRGTGGAFGPELTAAPGASETEAFMAWTGRRPPAP